MLLAPGEVIALIFVAGLPLASFIAWRRWQTRTIARLHNQGSTHNQPNNVALREQALVHQYGVHMPVDEKVAERLYREAYARGDLLAGSHLADMLDAQPGSERHNEASRIREICREPVWQLMLRENIEANYLVGQSAGDPELSDEDSEPYVHALLLASEAGYLPALIQRSNMEFDETGNEAQALIWYEKAHAMGSAVGTSCLGCVYASTDFAGHDLPRGIALLREAAARNVANACVWLAWLRQEHPAQFSEQDSSRTWLEQAVKLGNSDAMLDLAVLLRDGVDGPVDTAAARHLLKRAAEFSYDKHARRMLAQLDSGIGNASGDAAS